MPQKVVYLEGLQQMLNKMSRAENIIGAAVQKDLMEGGEHLKEKSLELVPRETENLAKSIVGPKNVGPKGLHADVVVYYDEKKAPYAIWVHEIANPPHAHGSDYNVKHAMEISKGRLKKKNPKEQWKFLEQPLRTERRTILKIIADTIRMAK